MTDMTGRECALVCVPSCGSAHSRDSNEGTKERPGRKSETGRGAGPSAKSWGGRGVWPLAGQEHGWAACELAQSSDSTVAWTLGPITWGA